MSYLPFHSAKETIDKIVYTCQKLSGFTAADRILDIIHTCRLQKTYDVLILERISTDDLMACSEELDRRCRLRTEELCALIS